MRKPWVQWTLAVVIATIVTMVVFAIPHSMWGSQAKWQHRAGSRGTARADSQGQMTESRRLLQHVLAVFASRAPKALRDAPDGFGEFCAGPNVRSPHERMWHMSGLVGYARTFFHGGDYVPPRVATLADEVARFHAVLDALSADLTDASLTTRLTDEQLLQGPLADALTHVGQLALLRRLMGAPVPSENFLHAAIRRENVSARQPDPDAPDDWWRPDLPPQPPGPIRRVDGHQLAHDRWRPRRIPPSRSPGTCRRRGPTLWVEAIARIAAPAPSSAALPATRRHEC